MPRVEGRVGIVAPWGYCLDRDLFGIAREYAGVFRNVPSKRHDHLRLSISEGLLLVMVVLLVVLVVLSFFERNTSSVCLTTCPLGF